MLSAIANFIFGGILSDVQDESLQCETTEVNDWLLVTMPNQPVNDTVDEIDSDEVLEDIHHLLALDDTCDNSFNDVISPSVLYEQPPLDNRIATQTSFVIEQCVQDVQDFPESLCIGHSFFYPSDFSLIASQYFSNPEFEELFHPDQSMLIVENKDCTRRSKTVVIISKDSKNQNVPDKRICHPAASAKNYVNHRSPAISPKTALLEQIQDLKPMQQAVEYELKKQVSKSQLNRRNKNYIYETSAKSNRRKNLWRNHSGANNNRKC